MLLAINFLLKNIFYLFYFEQIYLKEKEATKLLPLSFSENTLSQIRLNHSFK